MRSLSHISAQTSARISARISAKASLVVLCLLASGCAYSYTGVTPKAKRTMTHTVDHVAGTSVTVHSRNGGVEVRASDTYDTVHVEARLTCAGDTKADAEQRVAAASIVVSRSTNRELMIEPSFPGGVRNGDGASFVVHLPSAEGITVDTSNGAVAITGTSGALFVDTSNGGVSVSDHAGDIEVDTSNGAVSVLGATGPVKVDTSNGGITVELASASAGPIELDTSNGSIKATVRDAFHGAVTMDTSNARITVQDRAERTNSRQGDKSYMTLVVGETGPASRLDTSNGGITLVVDG